MDFKSCIKMGQIWRYNWGSKVTWELSWASCSRGWELSWLSQSHTLYSSGFSWSVSWSLVQVLAPLYCHRTVVQLEPNLLWDKVTMWLLGLNSLCKSLSCRAGARKQVDSYDCGTFWLNPDTLLWNFIPDLNYKPAHLQKEAFPALLLPLCCSLPLL